MQERFARLIKQMIEENPSFGHRTVAYLKNFTRTPLSASSSRCTARCIVAHWLSAASSDAAINGEPRATDCVAYGAAEMAGR